MNILKPTFSLLFALILFTAQGQDPMKKYKEAKTVYVIKDAGSEKTYTTSTNETFTFVDEVKKVWTDKTVIPITLTDYNKLPDLKNQIYISYTILVTAYSESPGILVQQGAILKLTDNAYRVAWKSVNIQEYNEGYVCERLKYYINQLHYQINNPLTFESYSLSHIPNYKEVLSKKTLVIRKDMLNAKEIISETDIQSCYPYKVKIVDKAGWEEIIKSKDGNYVFADEFLQKNGANNTADYNFIDAGTGMIIFTYSTYSMKEVELGKKHIKSFLK